MSVKGRIKNFIQTQKITVIEFERSINASNGYVNSIYKSIGIDKLNDIIEKYPNLNIEWLLTGKGEMIKSNLSNEINPVDNEWLLRRFEEIVAENALLKKEVEELRTTRGKSTNTTHYSKFPEKIGTQIATKPE